MLRILQQLPITYKLLLNKFITTQTRYLVDQKRYLIKYFDVRV